MIQPRDLSLFRELVERARRFVLTTHINPDGDAIGSQIGVASYLANPNRQVRIVNQDATPRSLRFVETASLRAEAYDPRLHDPVLAGADLVVLLDNWAPDRLGRMEEPVRAAAGRTLCIDHHPSCGSPWAHNILDEEACATAAMVYELTQDFPWRSHPVGAQALYVGLATDTGFFRFNSASPRTHEIAADLLRAGVEPASCYRAIYERNAPAYTRLMGHALAGLRLDAAGAVASVRITRETAEACEAADEDASEITTTLLATDGVSVAILFRETEDGRVKVSLRSKGDLDVHRLATEFGGGGHRNASGIVMTGRLDEVSERVIGRASALLRRPAAGRSL